MLIEKEMMLYALWQLLCPMSAAAGEVPPELRERGREREKTERRRDSNMQREGSRGRTRPDTHRQLDRQTNREGARERERKITFVLVPSPAGQGTRPARRSSTGFGAGERGGKGERERERARRESERERAREREREKEREREREEDEEEQVSRESQETAPSAYLGKVGAAIFVERCIFLLSIFERTWHM